MTIDELMNNIKQLSLAHKDIVSYQVGESFDLATSKSSERYPAVWFEIPIASDYNDKRKKTHTAALNVLTLAKDDDILDQMKQTSFCESIMDDILQAIDAKYLNIGISDVNSLTLRSYTDDDLVGIRVDITFIVGRTCSYKENFNIDI